MENQIFDSNVAFQKRFEDVYAFQFEKNPVYRTFLKALGYSENDNLLPESIPLLPVEAFKSAPVLADNLKADLIFRSSGTSLMSRSTHYVAKSDIYKKAISKEFYRHFPLEDVVILGLLPKYEDNPDSSLIWMLRYLINNDPDRMSKFIHQDTVFTQRWLNEVQTSKKTILLFGAAFGLLDFMNRDNPFKTLNLEVIETGGMKTHKREMSKVELRETISEYFEIDQTSIHSEYGMCELLSQMYAIGSEWFYAPHWVSVTIRDAKNPERECKVGEEGKVGIIDLANIYSCPFILTNDRGVMRDDGKFQVLGRWDEMNMRGCNFLIDVES